MMQHAAKWLIILTGALFIYKYGERATGMGAVLALGYVLSTALVASLTLGSSGARTRVQYLGWGSGILLVVAGVLVENFIPLTSLNVDRWSVIASFIDALSAGEYPYHATSHLGNPPGPMPIYFLIASPFYWLNQLALLAVAGYLAAIFWIVRYATNPAAGLFLLMLSPFMYWEIGTRSNIFTYSLLVLWALETFYRKRTVARAVLAGLLLSTRSVFGISYLLYFGSLLWRGEPDRWHFIRLGAIAVVSFALTFLPLILIWPDSFWTMNPFIVQSTFLIPLPVVIMFLMAAACAAVFVERDRLCLLNGMLLWTCILIYSCYHIVTRGFEAAIHDSVVDISYFLFAIPFLGYGWLRQADVRSL